MDMIDNPRLGVISHLPTTISQSEVSHKPSGVIVWCECQHDSRMAVQRQIIMIVWLVRRMLPIAVSLARPDAICKNHKSSGMPHSWARQLNLSTRGKIS